MKKMFVLAAAAAAIAATPAQAATGEGRVEVRGGIAWGGGGEEAFGGVGAGYDFDLGDSAFVGIDLGADKVLVGGAEVLWSVGARVGGKVGQNGRAFVNGGVGFCCGEQDPYAGVGYEHKVGSNVYLKAEYRHVFINASNDINFAGAGIGFRF